VKVPCAANAAFIPEGTVAVTGLTVIETAAAGLTVRRVDPWTAPSVAVIDDMPTETDVPRPAELMVATVEVPEAQLTDAVTSCWLPSVNVPVARNCWVVPSAIDGLAGLTVRETSAAVATVRDATPDTVPDDAEMVDTPGATLVAKPGVPLPLPIVAIELLEEFHWTEEVMFCWVPSVKAPVAANCSVVPSGIAGAEGVTEIESRAAEVTVSVAVPLILAAVAVMLDWPVPAPPARPAALMVATGREAELQLAELVRSSVLPSA
jgi:hypothetical protein